MIDKPVASGNVCKIPFFDKNVEYYTCTFPTLECKDNTDSLFKCETSNNINF